MKNIAKQILVLTMMVLGATGAWAQSAPTKQSNGTWKFTMPAGNRTLRTTWKQEIGLAWKIEEQTVYNASGYLHFRSLATLPELYIPTNITDFGTKGKYGSSNQSVATIDNSGNVSFVGVGETTIYAVYNDVNYYDSVHYTLTVNSPVKVYLYDDPDDIIAGSVMLLGDNVHSEDDNLYYVIPGDVTVQAVPVERYYLQKWVLGDEGNTHETYVYGNDTVNTIFHITQDTIITAYFAPKPTMTLVADGNGTVKVAATSRISPWSTKIFDYCHRFTQGQEDYPTAGNDYTMSEFTNPSNPGNSLGPWKVEYVGEYTTEDLSTFNQYCPSCLNNITNTYHVQSFPKFRLYQWVIINDDFNEEIYNDYNYNNSREGTIVAYANESNEAKHAALFISEYGESLFLTDSIVTSNSTLLIRFNEDLSNGVPTIVGATTTNFPVGVVDWKSTNTYIVDYGTDVSVTATPAEHHYMQKWNNEAALNSNVAVNTPFHITKDSILTAHFVQKPILTIASNNDEWGSVEIAGMNPSDPPANVAQIDASNYYVNYGTEVTVNATANSLHFVSGWVDQEEIGITTGVTYSDYAVPSPENKFPLNSSLTLTVTENTTTQANFSINDYVVSASVAEGQSERGTVQIAYTDGNGNPQTTTPGTSVEATALGGSTTTVTATPVTGYHFANWNGNVTANPCTTTLAASYTASFDTNVYVLTVLSDDETMGNVSGGTDNAKHFREYTISATPKPGYHFDHWNDNNTDNPRIVTLTENTTYTAYFAENPTLTLVADGDGTVTVEGAQRLIDLSTLTANYTAQDGDILTGTLDVANYPVKISVADGATVTLAGMNISGVEGTSPNYNYWAGITCLGDATIVLADGSTNIVKGFDSYCPGIEVGPTGKTLTIKGTGRLDASSNGSATSIGSAWNRSCGNITILNGTINATCGGGAAGIGASYSGSCGDITISGGSINVISGSGSQAAGIGAGLSSTCGNITINGGIINASGAGDGAGIGTGQNGHCGDITITNGVTSVTASKGTGTTNPAQDAIGRSVGSSVSCGTITIGGTVYWGLTSNPNEEATYVYKNDGANYLTQNTLTYNGNGNGTGTGSGSDPVSFNILTTDNPNVYSVYPGTEVTVTATPATNHYMKNWNNETDLNSNVPVNKDVTVNANTTITAHFAQKPTLTLMVEGNGNVEILGNPDGVTDNNDGTYTVNYGTQVTVTATPAEHHYMQKWTVGNNVNTKNSNAAVDTTFTVTETMTLTATFAANTYTITAQSANSTMGTASGTETVDYLTNVTLTATPNYGYHFVNWTNAAGTVLGTETSLTVQALRDSVITANFTYNTYTVTAQSANETMGSASGTATVNYLSTVTLTATPNYGYHFVNWTNAAGTVLGTETSLTVQALRDSMVYAVFDTNTYVLTVLSDNEVMGSVNGSTTAAKHFLNYQISATANEGYHFVQWNDGNSDNPRTVTLTQAATYTATFDINTYTLTLATNGSGSVSLPNPLPAGVTGSNGTYTVKHGTQVTVTATPATHYYMQKWDDEDPINSNVPVNKTVTVTENTTLTAYFAQKPILTLSTNPSDPIRGYVTIAGTTLPNYVAQIGTSSSYYVDYDSSVTVKATPIDHYHLASWNNTSGNALQQVVTMTSNLEITGVFAIDTFTLTLKTNDINKGYVEVTNHSGNPAIVSHDPDANGTRTYKVNYGAEVIIKATANVENHYHLASWSNGAAVNTEDTIHVTVTKDSTVTADFAINSHLLTINYVTPDGVTAPAQYSQSYEYGAPYSVASPAVEGYSPDIATVSGNMVDNDVTVTVTYTINSHLLTINYVTPDGVTAPAQYSQSYEYGAPYSVASPAVEGYSPDIATVSGNMVDNDLTVTVTYNINTYTLTLAADGDGTVTTVLPTDGVTSNSNGTYTVNHGTTVTVNATAAQLHHVAGWSDEEQHDLSTVATYSDYAVTNPDRFPAKSSINVTVTGDTTMMATFGINSYEVNASVANTADVRGTVQINYTDVDGQSQITAAGATAQATAQNGSTSTLTATPSTGYHFVKWQNANGTQVSTENPLSVTSAVDTAFTAVFDTTKAELAWSPNTFTGYTYIDFNNYKPTLNNPHNVSVRYGLAENVPSVKVNPETGYITNSLDIPILYTPGTYHVYAVHETDQTYYYDSVVYTLNVNRTALVSVSQNIEEGGSIAFVNAVNDLTHSYSIGNAMIAYLAPGASFKATATASANAGYHFSKWQTGNIINGYSDYASTDTTTYTAPEEITNIFTDGLRAVFAPDTFTITYMDGDVELNVDTFYYLQPITDYTVSKVGWDFLGWSPEVPEVMPAENLTVYAQWYRICDPVTDVDNNTYPSVNINNKCWMAENLRTTHYADGRKITNVYKYTSDLSPDTAENVSIYGLLYDWYDAVDAERPTRATHVQGICPNGWRLPNEEDFAALGDINMQTLRSTNYWVYNNGNNSTGFDIRPAGTYNINTARYEDLHSSAYFWSVTATSETEAHCHEANYYCDTFLNLIRNKKNAFSVRCVRD